MKESLWVKNYYFMHNETFYKQLANEKYHTEFFSLESGASSDMDKRPYYILKIQSMNGERNNQFGVILAVCIRMNRGESNQQAIERAKEISPVFIKKWVKSNLHKIPRSHPTILG